MATRDLVSLEKTGPVTVLTLDDPPANAHAHRMMRELDDRIPAARFDDDGFAERVLEYAGGFAAHVAKRRPEFKGA